MLPDRGGKVPSWLGVSSRSHASFSLVNCKIEPAVGEQGRQK